MRLLAFLFLALLAGCGSDDPTFTAFPTGSGNQGNGSGGGLNTGCEPETDEELCEAAGYTCGEHEIVDSCGATRTVESCGACASPETCGGGDEPGVCGCVDGEVADLDDDELCASHSAVCGELVVVDSCGNEHVAECGIEEDVCSDFDTCGGGGTPNVCGCTPATCASEELMCGERSDGCGGTITCDQFCVQTVRAGFEHACAIGSGMLRCWGRNQGGQLGIGDTTNQQNPAIVPNLPLIADVATGGEHTCALTVAGAVHCWGNNEVGQLGVGTTVSNNSVGAAAIGANATTVVSGAVHSCAIVDGGVQCWGSNAFGQIGNASLEYGSTAGVPLAVTGLDSGVLSIAAGLHHTCALKDDDTVWCWGRNQFGQTGLLVPQLFHSAGCGAPISAWAFTGANNELDAFTLPGPQPVQVSGLQSDIVELALGETISCARSDDGEVRCWGALTRACTAGDAQVGGRDPDRCAVWPPLGTEGAAPIARYSEQTCDGEPSFVIQSVFVNRSAMTPATVTNGAQSLSAGSNHLCFLVDEPNQEVTNIQCMGVNTFGQVGDGTDNPWAFPQSIFLDSNDNVVRGTQVTLGAAFTCARTGDDNVQCWGSNQHGQIGNSALDRDESFRPFDVRLIYEP